MIPLKLSYAFTPWKVQGQTITGKIVGDIGVTEKSDGLTYVLFSRVRKFSDVGIDGGLTYARLTRKIKTRVSLQRRILFEESVLKPLANNTLLTYEEEFGNLPPGVFRDVDDENSNVQEEDDIDI